MEAWKISREGTRRQQRDLEEEKMREEQGKEEEEQQEMDDLFLPQYLTRLSSAWNDNSRFLWKQGTRAHTRSDMHVSHAVEKIKCL